MQKIFYTISLLACLLLQSELKAQELQAQVQVLTPGIQATNKQIYQTMETAISEFLNNRKWTDESYEQEERIKCQFLITIKDRANNNFSGDLQVSYSRPVYMSDYSSPVFVHRDADLNFEYVEFDRLDFTLNTSISNLTSVLAYYVYIIIGLDHDTFSPKGGDPFFNDAQTIVGNSQGGNYTGWSSFDGNKNRFILVDNLLSPAFDNLRVGLYNYHRLGLDQMYEPSKQKAAKETIKKTLMDLKAVNDQRRNSFLMQLFFDAKSQEIINVFSGGDPMPLADLVELLEELDASNAQKYQNLGKA